LRPRYAKVVNGALLITLFIPGVISLVPLYLTVLDVPIVGGSLINTYWAIWLPAGARSPGTDRWHLLGRHRTKPPERAR
jgi:multiple sugar transport system permease protein